MKYAVIAAVAAVAAAAPADWEPAPTTTTSAEWEGYTTTTSCTTTAEWTTPAGEWAPVKPTTTPAAEWEPVKPKTTPAAEWVPVKPVTKCTTVSAYTTKVYKDAKPANGEWSEWAPYDIVTKYSTITLEKCPTTTWAEWVPVPTTKCSTVSVYTTKVYKDAKPKEGEWSEWAPYDIVTKTTTLYPTVCPTPAKVTETWAPISTPVKPAETWAPVSSKPAVATTSGWTPVATYKGAADKATFGMGALAIAAVAALL